MAGRVRPSCSAVMPTSCAGHRNASRLATGDLDGRVVTMTESGTWAYRVRVTREQIVETVHGTGPSRSLTRVPSSARSSSARGSMPNSPQQRFRPMHRRSSIRQSHGRRTRRQPRRRNRSTRCSKLGLGAVDTGVTGKLLWYDGSSIATRCTSVLLRRSVASCLRGNIFSGRRWNPRYGCPGCSPPDAERPPQKSGAASSQYSPCH